MVMVWYISLETRKTKKKQYWLRLGKTEGYLNMNEHKEAKFLKMHRRSWVDLRTHGSLRATIFQYVLVRHLFISLLEILDPSHTTFGDVILFENLRFQNVLCAHVNEKLGFQLPPVWRTFSKSSVFVTD